MHKVKSCGVLVVRRDPELAFLLMRHRHRVDLPKGHIQEGESEMECALRELEEETGISAKSIQLEEGFRFTAKYYPRYKRFEGETVEKTLVMFLGWLLEEKAISVTEHDDHDWIKWDPPHYYGIDSIDNLLIEVSEKIKAVNGNGTDDHE